MEIKLCYKVYPFKISKEACRDFANATGEDLHDILMRYLDKSRYIAESDLMTQMIGLQSVAKKEVAAQALYCLIKTENTSIPMAEIEDAMYRVSWLPSDRSDDLSEPYPMVMLDVAHQVNQYYMKAMPVKKKDTKDSQAK